jgi:hypothetical protein
MEPAQDHAQKARNASAVVRRMVEAGQVDEAREYLASQAECPELEAWREVLAPPRVTTLEHATGKSMKRDADWLAAHAKEYEGQWVALRDGQLVDADPDPVVLHKRLPRDPDLTMIQVC